MPRPVWSFALCFFLSFFFFFNDTATTEIYTLSLHDALPICSWRHAQAGPGVRCVGHRRGDRKSTRLNSSHTLISYAVFCLKKKKKKNTRENEIVVYGTCTQHDMMSMCY